jgi:hypothetical protein
MKYALMVSAALLGLAAVPATAMPIAPLNDTTPGLTLAAWGCGPGWRADPTATAIRWGTALGRHTAFTPVPITTLTHTTAAIAGGAQACGSATKTFRT